MPQFADGKCAPVVPREGQPGLRLSRDTRKLIGRYPQIKKWPGVMQALKAAHTKAIQQSQFELLSQTLKHQPKDGELDKVYAFLLEEITEKQPKSMEDLRSILNK